MTKKFLEWAVTDASSSQKNLFLQIFADEIVKTQPNFNPNTEEKIALWEAYCTATGQDSTLPGSDAPVYKDETPSA